MNGLKLYLHRRAKDGWRKEPQKATWGKCNKTMPGTKRHKQQIRSNLKAGAAAKAWHLDGARHGTSILGNSTLGTSIGKIIRGKSIRGKVHGKVLGRGKVHGKVHGKHGAGTAHLAEDAIHLCGYEK